MSDIDFDKVYELRDSLPAAEAKVAIQAYAKEIGIKIPKAGMSVKGMIEKLIDRADASANSVVVPAQMDLPSSNPDVVDLIETPETPEVVEIPETPTLDLTNAVIGEDLPVGHYSAGIAENFPTALPDAMNGTLRSSIIEDDMKELVADIKSRPGYVPRNDLVGRSPAYFNIPYWILDWIETQGASWKSEVYNYPDEGDRTYLLDMLYYIDLDGTVVVRESRNSHFHHFH